jgi:RNA recognition motif-containing protein
MSTPHIFFNRFPVATTEQDIHALFSPYGEVVSIELFKGRETGETYGRGRVTMASAISAEQAIAALNEIEIEGQPVRVKPNDRVHYKPKRRQPAPSLTQQADELASQLGENDYSVRLVIKQIIYVKGLAFAQALLEETLQVEAQGGLLTTDGVRRRTPGGVYFALLKTKVSYEEFVHLAKRGKKPQSVDQPREG